MHSYDKELQLFIRGERREEGWKSPWRIEQERLRAEEYPAPIVTAMQIKVRQVREIPRCKDSLCCESISRNNVSGYCRGCYSRVVLKHKRPACNHPGCMRELKPLNVSGRCIKHKRVLDRKTCPVTGCEQLMYTNNIYGICDAHVQKYRHMIMQTKVRKCSDCGRRILARNRTGLCADHSKLYYSRLSHERTRAKRMLLKEAA